MSPVWHAAAMSCDIYCPYPLSPVGAVPGRPVSGHGQWHPRHLRWRVDWREGRPTHNGRTGGHTCGNNQGIIMQFLLCLFCIEQENACCHIVLLEEALCLCGSCLQSIWCSFQCSLNQSRGYIIVLDYWIFKLIVCPNLWCRGMVQCYSTVLCVDFGRSVSHYPPSGFDERRLQISTENRDH